MTFVVDGCKEAESVWKYLASQRTVSRFVYAELRLDTSSFSYKQSTVVLEVFADVDAAFESSVDMLLALAADVVNLLAAFKANVSCPTL